MFSTMNSMVFVKTSLLLMLSTLLLKVYLIENIKTLIESPLDNNCNYSFYCVSFHGGYPIIRWSKVFFYT